MVVVVAIVKRLHAALIKTQRTDSFEDQDDTNLTVDRSLHRGALQWC